jgi:hypothetical protein
MGSSTLNTFSATSTVFLTAYIINTEELFYGGSAAGIYDVSTFRSFTKKQGFLMKSVTSQ